MIFKIKALLSQQVTQYLATVSQMLHRSGLSVGYLGPLLAPVFCCSLKQNSPMCLAAVAAAVVMARHSRELFSVQAEVFRIIHVSSSPFC